MVYYSKFNNNSYNITRVYWNKKWTINWSTDYMYRTTLKISLKSWIWLIRPTHSTASRIHINLTVNFKDVIVYLVVDRFLRRLSILHAIRTRRPIYSDCKVRVNWSDTMETEIADNVIANNIAPIETTRAHARFYDNTHVHLRAGLPVNWRALTRRQWWRTCYRATLYKEAILEELVRTCFIAHVYTGSMVFIYSYLY